MTLPPREAEALRLREGERLPYAEVAARLGVGHSTARRFVSEARRRLGRGPRGVAHGYIGCRSCGTVRVNHAWTDYRCPERTCRAVNRRLYVRVLADPAVRGGRRRLTDAEIAREMAEAGA